MTYLQSRNVRRPISYMPPGSFELCERAPAGVSSRRLRPAAVQPLSFVAWRSKKSQFRSTFPWQSKSGSAGGTATKQTSKAPPKVGSATVPFWEGPRCSKIFFEGSPWVCAVKRRCFLVGAGPTWRPLQLEATGGPSAGACVVASMAKTVQRRRRPVAITATSYCRRP
jgi:hypothetical protein